MYKRDPCLTFHNSPHSSHMIFLSLIAPSTSVLDVGCNTGYLAKILKRGNTVTDGIDINKRALEIARRYCARVFERNLYAGYLDIPMKKYDYIVFGDILEHLPRPDLLLKDAKRYLKQNGHILISLPNIARFEIRLRLLMGIFEYRDGILGEDHLRFFTKKSAINLIENCGLRIIDIIPTGLGHRLQLFDTLTAFQFVFITQK